MEQVNQAVPASQRHKGLWVGLILLAVVAGAGVLGYWWVIQGNQLLKPKLETTDVSLGTSEKEYTLSIGFGSRFSGWQVALAPEAQTWVNAAIDQLGYTKPVSFMAETEGQGATVSPDTIHFVFAPLEQLNTQERQQLLFPIYGGQERVLVAGIDDSWDGAVLVYTIYMDTSLLGDDPEVITQNWTYQTFRVLAAANPAKVQPVLIESLWGGMVAEGAWPMIVSKR